MVSSKATTPAAYLASLPPERRTVIDSVRALIIKRLPKGYVESMNWGMLAYEIPLSRFPNTYNAQPLLYLALAAQKNNFALYMTCGSGQTVLMTRLEAAYKAAGQKFDMGKSCLRFKSLDELPLDVIGDIIASTSVDERIAVETARLGAAPTRVKKTSVTANTATKSAAKEVVKKAVKKVAKKTVKHTAADTQAVSKKVATKVAEKVAPKSTTKR